MRLPGQTSEDGEGFAHIAFPSPTLQLPFSNSFAHIAVAGEAVGVRKGIDPLVEKVCSVIDLIIPWECASANGARDHDQKRLHICSLAH